MRCSFIRRKRERANNVKLFVEGLRLAVELFEQLEAAQVVFVLAWIGGKFALDADGAAHPWAKLLNSPTPTPATIAQPVVPFS